MLTSKAKTHLRWVVLRCQKSKHVFWKVPQSTLVVFLAWPDGRRHQPSLALSHRGLTLKQTFGRDSVSHYPDDCGVDPKVTLKLGLPMSGSLVDEE